MGPMNKEGLTFLRRIGRLLTQLSGDHRETAFLLQLISVNIQRFNAIAFHGTFSPINDCEEVRVKYATQAIDAEEHEHEGHSPPGIYIVDIPNRKISDTRKEMTEEDTTELLQPFAVEGEDEKIGSEDSQEKEEKPKKQENEDLIVDMEDAASRIHTGRRGILTQMTIKFRSLSGSQPCGDEEEEKEVGLLLPSEGRKTSDEGNKCIEEMSFRERLPCMDRSVSTMSTNTLTTLPSDGDTAETLNQSIVDISDAEIVKTEIREEGTKLEVESSISRRILNVSHPKPCKGSEDVLITRVKVNEDITVRPPYVTFAPEDDVTLEKDVGNSEELLDNRVVLVRKVTSTKVLKAALCEKDAPNRRKDRLPSVNFSSASPSSECLTSDKRSSDPQLTLGTKMIPVEGVLALEEELTEEKSRHTFRPSPWTSSKRKAEESQVTIDEIEGNCCSLVHKQLSTEFIIVCEDEEKIDGDMLKHSRVILRRRIHEKTLLTARCLEQTIVTEDTQVEQDNEDPKELSSAIAKTTMNRSGSLDLFDSVDSVLDDIVVSDSDSIRTRSWTSHRSSHRSRSCRRRRIGVPMPLQPREKGRMPVGSVEETALPADKEETTPLLRLDY